MGEAKWAGMVVVALALGLCSIAPVVAAQGPPYLIAKIADTNTPVPGGTGTYTSFGVPTYDSFPAGAAGGAGLYGIRVTSTGPLQPYNFSSIPLIDTSTVIPGGTGTFTSFDGLGLGDVFRGMGSGGQEGIYAVDRTTGAVAVVADKNTAIPGGTGTFTAFGGGPQRQVGLGKTTFQGQGAGGQQGIYSKARQADVRVVADKNTVAPDAGGAKFTSFAAAVAGQSFLGSVNGHRGAYISDDPTLRRLVDYQTPVDGTPLGGSILSFSRGPDFSPGLFRVDLGMSLHAVVGYSYYQTLEVIAFPGRDTPGRDAVFVDFTAVSFTWGTIEGGPEPFFQAQNSDDSVGIYTRVLNGPLTKVIDTSMLLDGKQVTDLSMGEEAVAGYSVTFRADFADGSSGIYRAYPFTPEPGMTGVALALGVARGLGRRGRRRLCMPG